MHAHPSTMCDCLNFTDFWTAGIDQIWSTGACLAIGGGLHVARCKKEAALLSRCILSDWFKQVPFNPLCWSPDGMTRGVQAGSSLASNCRQPLAMRARGQMQPDAAHERVHALMCGVCACVHAFVHDCVHCFWRLTPCAGLSENE